MPLRLHVCTSPADKRVYQEHLKVTTNNALKITHKSIFWLKFSLFYPVKITDRHFKACVLCSQRMWLQFIVMPPFSQCVKRKLIVLELVDSC